MSLSRKKRLKLIEIARVWSEAEPKENDVCLIGSWARGDPSQISDFDLVMFCNGVPTKNREEIGWLDDVPVSLFRVNASQLIKEPQVDFYNANNVFEAKLIYGKGRILNELKQKIYRKPIDLEATRTFFFYAFSNRLREALMYIPFDYVLGIRDLKTCLAKLRLYNQIFLQKVNPWSLIPYKSQPQGELEQLVAQLYYSNIDKMEAKITKFNLDPLMEKTFKDKLKIIKSVIRIIQNQNKLAGKYLENYLKLLFLVEEKVRRIAWPTLPSRAEIAIKYRDIDHTMTGVHYTKGKTDWLIFRRNRESRWSATRG